MKQWTNIFQIKKCARPRNWTINNHYLVYVVQEQKVWNGINKRFKKLVPLYTNSNSIGNWSAPMKIKTV